MKNFFIVLMLVIFSIVVGIVIANAFHKDNASPNAALKEYIQEQRRISDSAAQANAAVFTNLVAEARSQHTADSLAYVAREGRLLQSIQSIKTKYAQIPSYTDLSKDSLRRLVAAATGQ